MAATPSAIHIGEPPAGLSGELAPVIPLHPSPSEEGFFDHGLPTINVGGLLKGLGDGVARLANMACGQGHLNSPAMPRGVPVSESGYSHRFLVTEPDPASGVKSSEAKNTVFHPGLTEFGDLGSALRLHVAFAERHPEQRVITNPTEDVSHGGRSSGLSYAPGERIEAIAARNLKLLRVLTRDGPTEVAGTSLGTYIATAMAEQNLAANPHEQLNVTKLRFIASAVVACDVEAAENFRDPNLDEESYRQELTDAFFEHVAQQLLGLARERPADIAACAPIVPAYALHPRKLPGRLRALAADFRGVQEGVDWATLKQIVGQYPVEVLGGSLDPLVQAQIPQWDALGALFPGQVRQRIIPKLGHLMTVDARGTVVRLDRLESARGA